MLKVKFKIRNNNKNFEHITFSEEEMIEYVKYHKSHWQIGWSFWDINEETGEETENYNL